MMKPPLSYLEYQQLELIVPPKLEPRSRPSLRAKLKHIWESFVTLMSKESEPRVWCTCDRVGNTWWSAYDPVTGQATNEVSEAEIRSWIERRYH